MVAVDPPITLLTLRLVKYPQRPNTVRPNSAALLPIRQSQYLLALPLCERVRSAVSPRLLPYILILLTYRTCFLVLYECPLLESAVVVFLGAAYRSAVGRAVRPLVAVPFRAGDVSWRCYLSTVERLNPQSK